MDMFVFKSRFLLIIFLSICSFSHIQAAEERSEVNIPQQSTVVLKYVSFDPGRVRIDEMLILKGVAQAFREYTKFPLKSGMTGGHTIFHGLRTSIDSNESRIYLNYVHVERYQSGTEYGQVLTIPIAYQIERGNNDLTIRLNTPEKADFVTKSLAFFKILKLPPQEEVVDDFVSTLSRMQVAKLQFQYLAKGEIVSPYKPESCLGNLERLLGKHSINNEQRSVDVKKEGVFSYLLDQERIPVRVIAFPYREGTKITYEARLPYRLVANGTTEGYDFPEKLRVDLDKVIKD